MGMAVTANKTHTFKMIDPNKCFSFEDISFTTNLNRIQVMVLNQNSKDSTKKSLEPCY